jgi:[ribosomal protein S5]-alanine N-acetyltransferase
MAADQDIEVGPRHAGKVVTVVIEHIRPRIMPATWTVTLDEPRSSCHRPMMSVDADMTPDRSHDRRFPMSLHPQIRLVAATVPLLNALNDDHPLFSELIGSPIPDGWPEFPEAVGFTLEHLQNASDADRLWSMQFFVNHANGLLVGSGGFAAPPLGRTVEIGYEVAPAFRGHGFGTAAARALVERAVASGEVDHVIAHTRPGPNPSTGVLVSLDFEHVEDQEDPEVGVVWEWRWTRSLVG